MTVASRVVDIKVKITSLFNTGPFWSSNHLLVISDSKIKQIEASTGSPISEWPVPDTDDSSCIAQPTHGGFIIYSTRRTLCFWDTSTHIQLGLIQRTQDIRSIAVSPDDRFLAIGTEDGKINIENLSRIDASTREQDRQDEPSTSGGQDDNPPDPTPDKEEPGRLQTPLRVADSVSSSLLHPTFLEPDFQIDDAALDLWKRDQLTNAEA
ncbi:hypothetical protein OG21DRAFT_1505279 [Imleria badia]|nr:hypothetical protein OG21DRAFT_1505279 [Imleria badia]